MLIPWPIWPGAPVTARSSTTLRSSKTTRTGGISFSSTSTSPRDTGAGLGASHQTGWTGIVAVLLDVSGRLTGADVLAVKKAIPRERV